MLQRLHKNARTNYAIRQEILSSDEPINALATRLHLSWKTVKKWKERPAVNDRSSRPHQLRASLTDGQEDLILFERKKFKKSIEEIWLTLEHTIPNLYPMKVYRVLRRHGLNVLPDELLKAERQVKRFRRSTIGFLHIDMLYAPKIAKERWYIFTCIDRVSRAAYLWIAPRKTKHMGARFLRKVLAFYPYRIRYILTDNGAEFSYTALPKYRRGRKRKKTKRVHPFDRICMQRKIQHRTIKFKHPWTNGMVERFNGKVKQKVLRRYLFADVQDLNGRLISYVNHYNHVVRLRQLQYKTPNQYLKERFQYSVQRIVI